MILELPVTSDAAQTFVTQLGDVKYQFDVIYNDRSSVWTMTITEFVSQAVIISGLPLVLGQPLLEPYNFGIGELIVVDTSESSRDAGADDMGTRVKVYWLSPDEVLA